VFNKAMVCVSNNETGPEAEGWIEIVLPDALASEDNGLYYYVVQARRGSQSSAPELGKLYLAR
jgi:hypothetical protein